MLLAPGVAAACTTAGARSPSVATDTVAIVSHRFIEILLSPGWLPAHLWMTTVRTAKEFEYQPFILADCRSSCHRCHTHSFSGRGVVSSLRGRGRFAHCRKNARGERTHPGHRF